ncbi:hypothetical protein EON65_28425 [archaeon]|nr:MAG: hypothetical protein EON65_28425 [archaeon]
MSSLATTPFDVVKTRLSTGLLPPGSHVLKSLVQIGTIVYLIEFLTLPLIYFCFLCYAV